LTRSFAGYIMTLLNTLRKLDKNMDGIVREMVRKMTLEEKAGMCSGANWFETKSVERLGIPGIQMFDGPNGLRKNSGKSESDSLGSYRAV